MYAAANTHMVAGDDNDAFTATVLDYLDVLPAADAADWKIT